MTTKQLQYGTPNLGGKKINLIAKDDAKNVYTVPVTKIANGSVAMPFRHPEFALAYYKSTNDTLRKQFEIICQLARIRNHRIMRKCNNIISCMNGKKQFEFTYEMNELDKQCSKIILDSYECGVSPYIYLDETTDDDDVSQCTNLWCMEQNLTPGKASDNIIIITDLDNVDWFVVIERQHGPGRSQVAWAGGFVDKNETFVDAALREKNEEIDINIATDTNSNVTIKTITTELPVIKSKDWDPRARFVEGMENGAVVTHYIFSQ